MAESAPNSKSETALREEKTLAFWKEHGIFKKSLEKDAPKGDFVFFDGPPFATGLPHMGSLLSSISKDVVPRYKTMRGYHVRRRWGWDCHGLPIENMIEQQLALKSKKDIEKIGIDVFNEAARESVMRYEREWEQYVDRVGRWVDFRNSYKTMDNSYIESVWWALKSLHEKGLLYEGRKVLMYCPHCETPLAKAEIAMDDTYKDVTEEAVTVKFKVKNPETHGFPENTFLLAWTTTPWTLPGNVALAIGQKIQYVLAEKDGEHFIMAHDLVPEGLNRKKDIEGQQLLGISYEPLFDVPALKSEKSYKVYAADFVNTEEGTGIVHTAVMYGEDDFVLGQKEGLPMVQLLDSGAHYNEQAPEFVRGQYIKKAEKFIKEDLENRGLLFARATNTHSYPHCHRCGTPLIYNAVASWFINIQQIKERMLEENGNVHWVPEHLREGRFKHIVENAPDWTISRNRFWASPLPIWKEKGGSRLLFVGSFEELKARTKKSGNKYFLMRHGEAEEMLTNTLTQDAANEFGLTKRGREEVEKSAKSLPKGNDVLIVSSPVRRARESAAIVAEQLGIAVGSIEYIDDLKEMNFGIFDGRSRTEWLENMERPDWYTARPEGGESYEDAKIRFGKVLYELESRYANKTIVIVSHGIAFESLLPVCEGAHGENLFALIRRLSVQPAEVVELPFTPLPLNNKFELNFHRPYIDRVTLVDDEGREYARIPEVVDGWVESAAMPFAEWHYPFENKEEYEKRPVADFIAEYIAQTRTWFYYMHALGLALFNRQAFRTVVSTGTIVAADGAKVSKSKKNYTDPLALFDRFGADASRLYLMGSVVMQAEDLQFRDEDVREMHNRVIGILWNSYKFFELYREHCDGSVRSEEGVHPLDRWIRARLGELMREMTDAMENYDMPRAVRALRPFVDDYSTWYLRRSRDRVRGEGSADMPYALATQREVLLQLSKLIAPIAPFIAEDIYQGVGGEKESVHLEEWPQEIGVDNRILEEMALARDVTSKALLLRDRAGIKVRQPLSLLRARTLPQDEHIRTIVADELNVKKVEEEPSLADDVWLDTEISDVLREEGVLRDVLRAMQDFRKQAGLSVSDRPSIVVKTNEEGAVFFGRHMNDLMSGAGLAGLSVEEGHSEKGSLPFPAHFILKQ